MRYDKMAARKRRMYCLGEMMVGSWREGDVQAGEGRGWGGVEVERSGEVQGYQNQNLLYRQSTRQ